jgi:selenium metabolism protein YedF
MTFLCLSSDTMGRGNDELGRKLLKVFLEKLAASDIPIDMIGCSNHGVLLTTEGSEVIDSLRALEARGARIASCGTCIEHLNLQDKLLIGEVGNMDDNMRIMATADRVIKP